ncbi:MAG: ADP-ribosylation factor-like protein, partial [Promethearchaeota archaeon]
GNQLWNVTTTENWGYGIKLNSDDDIIVAGESIIQKYNSTGHLNWSVNTLRVGIKALEIDLDDYIYIAHSGYGQILKYFSNGTYITNSSDLGLGLTWGLYFDKDEVLHVGNNWPSAIIMDSNLDKIYWNQTTPSQVTGIAGDENFVYSYVSGLYQYSKEKIKPTISAISIGNISYDSNLTFQNLFLNATGTGTRIKNASIIYSLGNGDWKSYEFNNLLRINGTETINATLNSDNFGFYDSNISFYLKTFDGLDNYIYRCKYGLTNKLELAQSYPFTLNITDDKNDTSFIVDNNPSSPTLYESGKNYDFSINLTSIVNSSALNISTVRFRLYNSSWDTGYLIPTYLPISDGGRFNYTLSNLGISDYTLNWYSEDNETNIHNYTTSYIVSEMTITKNQTNSLVYVDYDSTNATTLIAVNTTFIPHFYAPDFGIDDDGIVIDTNYYGMNFTVNSTYDLAEGNYSVNVSIPNSWTIITIKILKRNISIIVDNFNYSKEYGTTRNFTIDGLLLDISCNKLIPHRDLEMINCSFQDENFVDLFENNFNEIYESIGVDGTYPKITEDIFGNIHVVWEASNGTHQQVYYQQRFANNNSWSSIWHISNQSQGSANRPSITTDKLGNIYFAWMDNTNYSDSGTDIDIVMQYYNISTKSWSSIEIVSNESDQSSVWETIKVDESLNIHVIWGDYVDYNGSGSSDRDLFYRLWNASTQTWHVMEFVSWEKPATEDVSSIPDMTFDLNGNPHIVWETLPVGDPLAYYIWRNMTSEGWSSAETISANDSYSNGRNPKILTDSNGDLHVALEGIDIPSFMDLCYLSKNMSSGAWSDPIIVSEGGDTSTQDQRIGFDIDENDVLYFTWTDHSDYFGNIFNNTDHDLYLRTLDIQNDSWGNIELVSDNSTHSSSYSNIIIDKFGNLHIVWQDQSNTFDSDGEIDVFYKCIEMNTSEFSFNNLLYEPWLGEPDFHIFYNETTKFYFNETHYKPLNQGTLTISSLGQNPIKVYPTYNVNASFQIRDVLNQSNKFFNGSIQSIKIEKPNNHIYYSNENLLPSYSDSTISWDQNGILNVSLFNVEAGNYIIQLLPKSTFDYDSSYFYLIINVNPANKSGITCEKISQTPNYPDANANDEVSVLLKLYNESNPAIPISNEYIQIEIFKNQSKFQTLNAFTNSTGYYEVNFNSQGTGSYNLRVIKNANQNYYALITNISVDTKIKSNLNHYDEYDPSVIIPGQQVTVDIDLVQGLDLTSSLTQEELYQLISNGTTNNSMAGNMIADVFGNLHFVWYDDGGGNNDSIFYRKRPIATLEWSNAIQISDYNMGDSSYPNLCTDDSGNIFVFWNTNGNYSNSGTDLDIVYRIWNATDYSWSPIQVVSTESNLTSIFPSSIIDTNNNIHVVWMDESDYDGSGNESNAYDIFYKFWNKTTESWSLTEYISTEDGESDVFWNASFMPSIRVDSKGNPHVSWYLNWLSGSNQVRYKWKNMTTGIWTTTLDPNINVVNFTNLEDCRLFIDRKDNVHFVYEGTNVNTTLNDGDCGYRMFNTSSQSWGDLIIFTDETSPFEASDPDICIDQNDIVHIVWNDRSDYFGAKYDANDRDVCYVDFNVSNNTWGNFRLMSNNSNEFIMGEPRIIVDRFNIFHVIWFDSEDVFDTDGLSDVFYRSISPPNILNHDTNLLTSKSNNNSKHVSQVMDIFGSLHVVWEEENSNNDIYYKKWNATSKIWGEAQKLNTESTGNCYRPKISSDKLGNLYVMWFDTTDYYGIAGSDYDVVLKKWNVSTSTWSSIEIVSNNSDQNSYFHSFQIDDSLNIHVVWLDFMDYNSSTTADRDVFYKIWNATTQEWSMPDFISYETGSLWIRYYPDITLDINGNPHVVWHEQYLNERVCYKFKNLTTNSWSVIKYISSNETFETGQYPKIDSDSLGNIHIVFIGWSWESGSYKLDVHHIKYNVTTQMWSIPKVISEDGDGFAFQVDFAIDDNDNLHVAWEDTSDYFNNIFDGGDRDLFYRFYNKTLGYWNKIYIISDNSTEFASDFCLIADNQSYFYVAWEDDSNDLDSGTDKDIFLRSSNTDLYAYLPITNEPLNLTLYSPTGQIVNTQSKYSNLEGKIRYQFFPSTNGTYILSINHDETHDYYEYSRNISIYVNSLPSNTTAYGEINLQAGITQWLPPNIPNLAIIIKVNSSTTLNISLLNFFVNLSLNLSDFYPIFINQFLNIFIEDESALEWIVINFSYENIDLPSFNLIWSKLRMAFYNESNNHWELLSIWSIDATDRVISCNSSHLSFYTVLGIINSSSSSSDGDGKTDPGEPGYGLTPIVNIQFDGVLSGIVLNPFEAIYFRLLNSSNHPILPNEINITARIGGMAVAVKYDASSGQYILDYSNLLFISGNIEITIEYNGEIFIFNEPINQVSSFIPILILIGAIVVSSILMIRAIRKSKTSSRKRIKLNIKQILESVRKSTSEEEEPAPIDLNDKKLDDEFKNIQKNKKESAKLIAKYLKNNDLELARQELIKTMDYCKVTEDVIGYETSIQYLHNIESQIRFNASHSEKKGKVIFLGLGKTGKTSFKYRFLNIDKEASREEVHEKTKTLTRTEEVISDEIMKDEIFLNILDTGGQKTFLDRVKDHPPGFWKKVNVVVWFIDSHRLDKLQESFKEFMEFKQKRFPENVKILLALSKYDNFDENLGRERDLKKISFEDVKMFGIPRQDIYTPSIFHYPSLDLLWKGITGKFYEKIIRYPIEKFSLIYFDMEVGPKELAYPADKANNKIATSIWYDHPKEKAEGEFIFSDAIKKEILVEKDSNQKLITVSVMLGYHCQGEDKSKHDRPHESICLHQVCPCLTFKPEEFDEFNQSINQITSKLALIGSRFLDMIEKEEQEPYTMPEKLFERMQKQVQDAFTELTKGATKEKISKQESKKLMKDSKIKELEKQAKIEENNDN